ncbi:hypothetical protein A2U01_0069089 [Trifolium medium]|uniref:Uncharacterized protein n=1 Tax=Trifolium medium TaxID=97028 RepID=A0A392SHE2_9FABA|nr:hypothetical protein [Trifolium medium]
MGHISVGYSGEVQMPHTLPVVWVFPNANYLTRVVSSSSLFSIALLGGEA